MTDAKLPALPQDPGEFILYQTDDGLTRVDVRMFQETVWLSLGQMAELFQRDKSVISRHIANDFEERELQPAATSAESATVQAEHGRRVERAIEHFNLNVIISVGYRVKSQSLDASPPWGGGLFYRLSADNKFGFKAVPTGKFVEARRTDGSVFGKDPPCAVMDPKNPPNHEFGKDSSIFVDAESSARYPLDSTPAGPLPQGTLSLGGFSFFARGAS